ncbi:major facilitator superfamily domain-containing protein [Mycotypha africana]|uniref:major facilitator superfamily domain-containing protein n=1 Tax=Mycotypha africana TaxID=64632 RepID=UPI002300A204|nr:major facilitator superfamily domain-containing protein [Mycotypha africana]KAI8991988.1 major facilitator superfamily domain-containing protein [Mycotypha africana]
MWLQTIAIILPRVQEHYSVSDEWIGTLSSSIFAGMTFGAFFWGTYSDSRGRKVPYTMTLAITSLFGLISTFTYNFTTLCVMLFFLGFGVGGNMPTDGALFLEFLPKEFHYLLTFMSVFFSFGAVIASIIAYIVLPRWSCPQDSNIACDISTQNLGWRLMLLSVSIVTILMLAMRTFWLRLPETPKFLMSQDKHEETIIVLQNIAKINGGNVQIDKSELPMSEAYGISMQERRNTTAVVENPSDEDDESDTMIVDDSSERHVLLSTGRRSIEEISINEKDSAKAFQLLFGPKWRLTTVLVWIIWTFTAVAYTMFNVFLPKYLETLGFEGEAKAPSHQQVYWDYMIYSIAGVPGSVIASWMIETNLGRKGTMAISALGSSVCLFLFSIITSRLTMVLSSSSVSFLVTLLYAVIYGYTPEVFGTNVRGTAVGTASGLGRIAGILSPIMTGFLLAINPSLPLYLSVVGFTIVGICALLLPYETRKNDSNHNPPPHSYT